MQNNYTNMYCSNPCQSSVGTITFQCQKSVSHDAYILQADNHNCLSGITKAGKEPIMAEKPTPDVYCEFRMNKLEGADEGLFAFQAITGLYLSKCTHVHVHPRGYETIEAKKIFH